MTPRKHLMIFFGLARMLLPNFTFAEFMKMVQHITLRQKMLLTGKFDERREKSSAVGYIMDYDSAIESSARSRYPRSELSDIVELA